MEAIGEILPPILMLTMSLVTWYQRSKIMQIKLVFLIEILIDIKILGIKFNHHFAKFSVQIYLLTLRAMVSPDFFSITYTTKPNPPAPKKHSYSYSSLKFLVLPTSSANLSLGILVTLNFSFINLRIFISSTVLPTLRMAS